MKTFEVIQDTRFSDNAKQNVIEWSKEIYNNLIAAGVIVYKEPVNEMYFKGDEPCISYRVKFYIDKYSNKLSFTGMQAIVNTTKPVRFENVNNKNLSLTFKGLCQHHTI